MILILNVKTFIKRKKNAGIKIYSAYVYIIYYYNRMLVFISSVFSYLFVEICGIICEINTIY
jgi:hypothetical protein